MLGLIAVLWLWQDINVCRNHPCRDPQGQIALLNCRVLVGDWDPKASSSASLVHNEQMKMLGPVLVGVGLFVLICVIAVVYENRDRN